MSSVIPFIIWLFCVGLAALIIGKAIEGNFFEPVLPLQTDDKKEGFIYGGNSNSGSGIVLTTCPTGTESYVTESGNTYCCNGDIVDWQCNGKNICSLSPNPPMKGLDTCSGWLIREWKRRSERFCTRDMPHYFGQMNRGPGIKEGCSASKPTSNGSLPFIPTDPQCKIYDTREQELANVDSCYNVQAMENLVCPQANATKSRVIYPVPGKAVPAILKCNYLPSSGRSNGMPVDCMDVESVFRYLEARDGDNLKQSDRNWWTGWFSSCVAFCGASKAFYVDGTLTADRAQCVTTMGAGGATKAAETPSSPCKFDDATYLRLNPDVKKAGVDAKVHYKAYGINEGRQICPTGGGTSTATVYSNNKVYNVGDMVTLEGKTYKMVEAAGSAGYSPLRAGDKLWSLQ